MIERKKGIRLTSGEAIVLFSAVGSVFVDQMQELGGIRSLGPDLWPWLKLISYFFLWCASAFFLVRVIWRSLCASVAE